MASTFIGMKITKENNKSNELTLKELKGKLDELGIEYNEKAKKAELIALLPQE